jgi:CBS domain-containing protein
MNPTRRTARIAGALYLLSAAAAGVPLLYVPSALIVPDNAVATAKNILVSEMVFRACIVSELVGAILFVLLVRTLYRLLNGVDKTYASLMVALVLVSVPVTSLNTLNDIVALTLLHGATFLSVFDRPQRDALAMLFLGLHGEGINLANIFNGLWLFPFGILVMRSGFIPRILGILLIADCCALVAVSLTALLLPAYLEIVSRVAIIPELGELWMMGWLLIRGIRGQPLPAVVRI